MLDRNWQSYMNKCKLKESADRLWPKMSTLAVAEHAANRLDGFETHILRLPQPIWSVMNEVKDVMSFGEDGTTLRVYPPFRLNVTKAISGEFQDVWIPEGKEEIERYSQIPSSAVKGLSVQFLKDKGGEFCQGLRVDCQSGAPERKIVSLLLDQIAQYTHQWWLRAGTSPFHGLGRFGAEINKDFSLREELRYRGAGDIESTWYGLNQTQTPLGNELPLTNQLWLLCCHHASEGRHAEPGFLSFYDALVAYKANDDPTCIFRLANCVEILGNKRRLLQNKKLHKNLDDLVKMTDLVDSEHRKILKKLVIDRGHIAHGREIQLAGKKNQPTVEEYVGTVRELLSNYLKNLGIGEWPAASQLPVKRKKNSA